MYDDLSAVVTFSGASENVCHMYPTVCWWTLIAAALWNQYLQCLYYLCLHVPLLFLHSAFHASSPWSSLLWLLAGTRHAGRFGSLYSNSLILDARPVQMSIGKPRNLYSPCSYDKICGQQHRFLFHCNIYNKTVFVRGIVNVSRQSADEMTVVLTVIVCLNFLRMYKNVTCLSLFLKLFSGSNIGIKKERGDCAHRVITAPHSENY